MIPIIGFLMLWLLNKISLESIRALIDVDISVPMPYIFGLDYKPLKNLASDPYKISNCDKWFFFEFEDGVDKSTINYWGENTGTPWRNATKTRGLINGRKNMISSPCN